jgi:hypothetical protein
MVRIGVQIWLWRTLDDVVGSVGRNNHLDAGLLYALPADIYLDWIRIDPPRRASTVMRWLPIATKSQEGNLSWHPALENFIAEFGYQEQVLAALSTRLHPRSWWGSLAIHLEPQLKLLESWSTHPCPEVRRWVRDQINRTNIQIQEARQRSDEDHVRWT